MQERLVERVCSAYIHSMFHRFAGFTGTIVALVALGWLLFFASRAIQTNIVQFDVENGSQSALVQASVPVDTSAIVQNHTHASTSVAIIKLVQTTKATTSEIAPVIQNMTTPLPASSGTTLPTSPVPDKLHAVRIQNPYSLAPLPFDHITNLTHKALVNILCVPHGGTMKPISGTGVIIDPRGIVLTNAHVAQYVFLSEVAQVNLVCFIRTGSPATTRWTAEVLYIPPVWVRMHAADINIDRPMGTGEHDYALLRITGSVDGAPLPVSFPFVSFDTREAIGFVNDTVLIAAYPVEFMGDFNIPNNLYAVSSVSSIAQLLTFDTGTVDLVSVGNVIEAQSGSSGGALVNAWGQLIGIITTVSDGKTITERTLRSLTLSYIDRDLKIQTGVSLRNFLHGDLIAKETNFNTSIAPDLLDQYATHILK